MVGDTLVTWEAPAYSGGTATLDLRNDHPVLDFDPNGIENALFEAMMPAHFGGGSLTVRLVWMATTGTAGVVMWQVLLERHDTSKDLDVVTWVTGNNVYPQAPAVSGAPAYTEVLLGAFGLLAGEHFRIQVARIASDASDTMAGDAELLGLELREA